MNIYYINTMSQFNYLYRNTLIQKYNSEINLELYKYDDSLDNIDIDNEHFFRINHIIPNFTYELQSLNDNIEYKTSIYQYINKYIIYEYCYYDNVNNNGKWYQNMYLCEYQYIQNKNIYKIKISDKTTKIPLLSNLQFINCKKEMSFITIGQLILDEFKNIMFVVMDVYYPHLKDNIDNIDINNSIYSRINYLNDILTKNYIYSLLDIFIIKSNNIFLFNKENIEYYLKNTLLYTSHSLHNENKLPIQSIHILKRNGDLLFEIETCNSIHLNFNELNEFINNKYTNFLSQNNYTQNQLIIYKHIFDFNITTNIELKTNQLNKTKYIHFYPNLSNSDTIYRLYTFKNFNSQSYLSNLSDIFYVSSIEINNIDVDLDLNKDIDPIIKECKFYEKYFLVYIPNIKFSKLFRKLYKEAIIDNQNGFWFDYKFNIKLNKFIPI